MEKMAIYCRFTSEKEFSPIPLADQFISLPDFKKRIFESKFKAKNTDSRNPNGICMGTDMDLKVINAQTNLQFADGAADALIPNGTFVLLKRVPGDRRRRPMNTAPIVLGEPKVVEEKSQTSSSVAAATGVDFHDFGERVLAAETASAAAGSSSSTSKTDAAAVVVVAMSMSREEEDARIRALVNTPALDWGQYSQYNGSHSGGGLVWTRVPPVGYVCHRCKVPGHFIQHCPTNGDPNYDFKRTKRPIGIPRSRLVADPDGSYKLPDGGTAVLTPDEDAFNREMESISSSSSSLEKVAKKLRTSGATDVSDITQSTVSQKKNEPWPEDMKQETSELVEPGKKRKRSRTSEATDVSDITQTTVSQKNELLPEDIRQETSELVEPEKKKRKRSSKENCAANGMPVAPWYPAPYATNMPYMTMPWGFNMQYLDLGSQTCMLPVPHSYYGW